MAEGRDYEGEHVVGVTDGGALKAADLRLGNRSPEVGIFASTFDDAAPTRIASDVQHGSKSPLDSYGTCLCGSDGLCALDLCGIP